MKIYPIREEAEKLENVEGAQEQLPPLKRVAYENLCPILRIDNCDERLFPKTAIYSEPMVIHTHAIHPLKD